MSNSDGNRQDNADSGDEARLDVKPTAMEAGHSLQRLPQADLAAAAAPKKAPTEETEEAQEAQQRPRNKKQKIKDAGGSLLGNKSDPAAEPPPPLCITADILKDVLPTVVAFVEPSDRCSVVLANSNLRDAVEMHSKNMLTKIKKEHAFDDTFDDRIRDQTRIQTTRTKPVQLPHRYLLEAAKRTRLYTIVPFTMHAGWPSYGVFALNSSKNRLVFAEQLLRDVCSVRIFDLKTKHCVQSFSFQNSPRERATYPSKIEYYEIFIMVFTEYVIRVFTETGELLHQFQTEGGIVLEQIFGSTRHKQVLFFDCNDAIYSLDICSGESKKIVDFEESNPVDDVLGVCHSRWLVAAAPPEAPGKPGAIIVYDLNNECMEKHRLEVSFGKAMQCTENPLIFYSLENIFGGNIVHMLQLSAEGKLSRVSSCSIPTRYFLHCNFRRRLFSIPGNGIGRSRVQVQVVRTVDGKVEGSLALSADYDIVAVVPNGSELFLGISDSSTVQTSEGFRGTTVAAFLSDMLM